VGLLLGVVYHFLPPPNRGSPDATGEGGAAVDVPPVTDPRLTLKTPYRNVHPSVKFMGDKTCSACHEKHARTFHSHPMGLAMDTVQAARPVERFDAMFHNPLFTPGFRYDVERRGERVFHRETRLDAKGETICAQEVEVHYACGSGTHGRSYLIERGSELYMSPLTWYPEKQRWDLSPAYHQVNQHFSRPITAECLFCHCNQANYVPDGFHRYRKPVFNGMAIGCERCHGPGELHVDRRQREPGFSGFDDTIVNPRDLSPPLREAVCQQCHLQGASRVACKGCGPFDFRPGLPLHAFLSVFVKPPELSGGSKFVGQVEQMIESRCYKASGGKMGCISCHDPHHKPPDPGERVAFYRSRCLTCHETRGCSITEPARRKLSPQDDCMQCHMPRQDADITHTSISDHRVLRKAESPSARPADAGPIRVFPLVYFHAKENPPDSPAVRRDLGVALMDLASSARVEAFRQSFAKLSAPFLEEALAKDARDIPAIESRATALSILGENHEAARLLDELLAQRPEREPALDLAGSIAFQLGRHQRAIDYWNRAIRLSPNRWRYHAGLANAHAQLREWSQALYHAERTLALHQGHVETRTVLVIAVLERGDRQRARRELELLLRFDPPNADELKKRFADVLANTP
jgi:hypothetical protein